MESIWTNSSSISETVFKIIPLGFRPHAAGSFQGLWIGTFFCTVTGLQELFSGNLGMLKKLLHEGSWVLLTCHPWRCWWFWKEVLNVLISERVGDYPWTLRQLTHSIPIRAIYHSWYIQFGWCCLLWPLFEHDFLMHYLWAYPDENIMSTLF